MKIKIDDILQEGLDINVTEKPDDFSFEERDIFQSPIHLNVKITKSGSDIYVNGTIKTKLSLECSRCLIEFSSEVEDLVYMMYVPKSSVQNYEDKLELNGNELDIAYYEGDSLDITDIIRQQLLLAIPMKPLCKDDCLGLCPICGVNRNLEKCGCKGMDIDPRLDILKKLMDKK